MLDPLTFKYSAIITEKKPLEKFAQDAPALDLAYKDDFSLLVMKCLIKAIESRLIHGSPEKRQAFVNEAMRQGFILTAAFADLLPAYEKQEEALRLYYPDLLSAIDVGKEQKRIKRVQFVESVPPRIRLFPRRESMGVRIPSIHYRLCAFFITWSTAAPATPVAHERCVDEAEGNCFLSEHSPR